MGYPRVMSTPISIPITLATPAGPLTVTVVSTEDKVPIPTVMGSASALSNALNTAAIGLAERHGHPIQCGQGCGACCRQLVPVSPIEAFALSAALQALPDEKRSRIEARIDATLDKLGETGLADKLQHIPAGPKGRAIVLDYFAAQLPCPFLEDESCQVYDKRPFACRDLLVSSNPSHCEDPGAGQVRRIPVFLDMGRAVRSLSAAAFGEVSLQMPLPVAIDWAREHDDLLGTVARGVDLVKGLMSALAGQRKS